MKPPMLPPLEKCSPIDRTTMMRTRASSSSVSNDQPQLVALRHRNDVVGRPVEDDVGALMRLVDLDLETVELGEPGIGESVGRGHVYFLSCVCQAALEGGACSRW